MKTNPCRYCHGTARITYRHPTRAAFMDHECTSCNGTGIDGDPRWAFWLIVLIGVAMVIGVGYAVTSVF